MLPSAYLLLDTIPLTIQGKVDQQALPAPQSDSSMVAHNPYVAPTTPDEKILTEIWEDILEVDRVGVEDNFFELGGHSLSALRLLSKIQSCFARKLKLRVIFESPTIKGLCKIIREAEAASSNALDPLNGKTSPLIKLQSQGDENPLFLVHPVGGTIFWYQSLVRYMDKTRPVYGFQDPGLETGKILFTHFEEMARFYVQCMRAVKPTGPYLVGGASYGANLAVEMAKQLIAEGETIEAVIALDGWAGYPSIMYKREFMQENMWRQHEEFKKQLQNITANISKPIVDLHWQRTHLLADYELVPFEFDLILFKPRETLPALQENDAPDNHWHHYAENLQIISVPGDHASMFDEPHVLVLAQQLDKAIMQSTTYKGLNIEKMVDIRAESLL